jgi:hypothetical protein
MKRKMKFYTEKRNNLISNYNVHNVSYQYVPVILNRSLAKLSLLTQNRLLNSIKNKYVGESVNVC